MDRLLLVTVDDVAGGRCTMLKRYWENPRLATGLSQTGYGRQSYPASCQSSIVDKVEACNASRHEPWNCCSTKTWRRLKQLQSWQEWRHQTSQWW